MSSRDLPRAGASLATIASLVACVHAPVANAVEPPPGLTHYRCYICHTDREPMVGPAFADIAAFNRGKPGAVDRIAANIRKGVRGGGPWHMPPHPEIPNSYARAMARYIMSLADAKAAPLKVDGSPAVPAPASPAPPSH